MQFTITALATLFAVAIGAPTDVVARSDISARQTTFTEFATWAQSGCKDGSRTGTINLTTQTTCQNFPAGVVSGKVDIDIPAGCQIVFYVGQGCSSSQIITVPKDQKPHICFEMGQGKQIGSALVSGTCSPF